MSIELKQAAQQAESEPVAWLYIENGEVMFGHPNGYRPPDARPLVFGDTHPAPDVPEGYALVPIEPTQAMLNVQTWDFSRFYSPREIWAAMLAAKDAT